MTQPNSTANTPDANLGFKAGLLMLLLALLLGASVIYLLYARGAFEETQRLVLIADDSEGVMVGTDMTFSGFPIGRVVRIELAADSSARMLIDVPIKDAHWLRESSVFTLTRGLVGGTHLRAYTGIPTDPPLPAGAERKVLIGDATADIPRLVSEAHEVLRNVAALTAADAPLAASLAHVQEVTGKLNERGALAVLFGNDADAKKLINALDRSNALLRKVDGLAAKADGLAAKADTQVFGVGGVLPEARAAVVQLNAALGDARTTLKGVDAVLEKALAVARNAQTATADLDVLRAEVDASLRKVDGMITELNRRWPFSREREVKLP